MTELHDAARAYLGVPFRHQGRSRLGADCIGLTVMALRDWGRLVSDVLTYSQNPHNGLLEENLIREFGAPISVDEMRPGDIVAIAFYGRLTRHVGIIGDHPEGGLSLIHTDQMRGKVVEHGIDKAWARRITGVWRPSLSQEVEN